MEEILARLSKERTRVAKEIEALDSIIYPREQELGERAMRARLTLYGGGRVQLEKHAEYLQELLDTDLALWTLIQLWNTRTRLYTASQCFENAAIGITNYLQFRTEEDQDRILYLGQEYLV